METRASHVIVGAFVLLLLIGAAGFLIWLGRYSAEEQFALYDIYFTDSVTGLTEGGSVRFRGVEVGTVENIAINPLDIGQIRVTIRVKKGTPVRSDARASLELQGITGLVYVQIEGGTNRATMLAETDKEPYPTIEAEPSRIAQILEGAPDLISRAATLLEELRSFTSDENRQAMREILDNIRNMTSMLASYSAKVDGFLVAGTDLATQATSTAAEYEVLAKDLQTEIKRFGDGTDASLIEVRKAAAGFTRVSKQLDDLIKANRRPIDDFTSGGLYEFTQLMIEARTLVESLTRVSQQLERAPSRFLFGDRQRGVEIQ